VQEEEQLLMTQAERDRLVTLRKIEKKLITQAEAAAELQLSVRHVKRMLQAMRERGDQGGGAWAAWTRVEPQERREGSGESGEDPIEGGVSRDSVRRWRVSIWRRI
jgi:hypothetical protein